MAYGYALCNRSGKLLSGFDSGAIPIDENGRFKSNLFLKTSDLNSNQFIWNEDLQALLDMKIDMICKIDRNRDKYNARMVGLADKMKRVVSELKPCIPCVDNIILVDEQGNHI